MITLKRLIKRNSHNDFFKVLAGFGRALNRFYENRNHDVESNGELTILKKLTKIYPSLILDGGANIGNYSILANQIISGCKIYSFEPVNNTYQALVNNTLGYKNIIPINKGLFRSNCSDEIYLFDSDEHSSLFDIEGLTNRSQKRQTIDLVRGDDFLKEENIEQVDLLKLDIEGAEYDALVGFENSLKKGIIKVIQFEYGYINITTKKLLIDYYNFFEKYDYIVGKIFPKTVEFRKYNFIYEDFIGPNFIAVKKSETELIKSLSKL